MQGNYAEEGCATSSKESNFLVKFQIKISPRVIIFIIFPFNPAVPHNIVEPACVVL